MLRTRAFALLAVWATLAAIGWAQIGTSTITGRITDPTGAVVPGATITVVHTGTNFTFNTPLGPLDLLGWVEPLGGYDDFISRCERMKIDGRNLMVLSLPDLITIKRHIARPKDQAVLAQLEAIQRLRETGGTS